METTQKKPISKVILALSVLLVVAGMVMCICTAFSLDATIWIKVASACSLLALIAAFCYVTMGYTKSAAQYYKVFVGLFALSQLTAVIGTSVDSNTVLPIPLQAIILALAVILLVTRDLGLKKSLIICILAIAFALFATISGVVSISAGISEIFQSPSVIVLRNLTQLVLCVLMLIITCAKYIDKANRKAE